jgi:hypothetical protein
MEHTVRTRRARLLSPEFSTVVEKRKTASYVIAFDSARSVCLRVSGSFCEDEAEPFFVWFAITYIGNAPFDPWTATRGEKCTQHSALMPTRDERG